jgi:3'-phosphoadenosine 5'-phosphosulfate sulfotransferase (PAPS reductase)/FAD synthetase
MAEPLEPHVASSLNLLRIVRASNDAIGVAVSFGKDSLTVLDLCARLFPRVEGYYLFRVADLDIVAELTNEVWKRHRVRILTYPHFDLARCYQHAVLQPHWKGLDKTRRIGQADIERAFRKDAGVSWIAYGWRRNDSYSRTMIMKKTAGLDPETGRVFPLRAWRKQDVLRYLERRGIPRPPSLGREEQGGLDFNAAALAELRDRYPADWARWQRDFPFSGVQFPPRR